MTPLCVFKSHLSGFAKSEDGAVTADWVVMTAVVVALCMALMTIMDGGVSTGLGSIAALIASAG